MIKTAYLYFLSFFLFSCHKKDIAPVWPRQSTELILPSDEIVLNWSSAQQSTAILYTFSQPIALPVEIRGHRYHIDLKKIVGVTEGPGELCIVGKQTYCFPVMLKNKKNTAIKNKTFYSPRTFDPDSSLQQQRISINMDTYRNLYPVKADNYFFEQVINVPSKSGTYCPEVNNPLSCFYVKSGACSSIAIRAYKAENNSSYMEAGPLLDQYGNLISNGTLLKFIFYNENKTYVREELVVDGYAKIKLNILSFTPERVKVMIGKKLSKELILNQ